MDVEETAPDKRLVHLNIAAPIAGLTLQLPADWIYLNGVHGTRQSGSLLSIGAFSGKTELEFQVNAITR